VFWKSKPAAPPTEVLPQGWSSNHPDPRKIIPPQGGSATAKPALPKGGSSHRPAEYEYRYVLYWQTSKSGDDGKSSNLDHVNSLLKDGWVPVRETPATANNWWCGIVAVMLVLRRPKPAN
jgi:hypothetical protein